MILVRHGTKNKKGREPWSSGYVLTGCEFESQQFILDEHFSQ